MSEMCPGILSMKQIFDQCQDKLQTHPKLIQSLKKIYENSSLDEFSSEFFRYLKYSMVVSERHPCVERTLEFVSKFVVSLSTKYKDVPLEEANVLKNDDDTEEMENPFLLKLFEFLLKASNAQDAGVRFRVCFMVNKILSTMSSDAVMDDELFQKIYESMLERLQDKVFTVRIQAVLALARLQDPSNKNCPVIEAYLFHLSYDPCHDVRRAVLSCIGASTKTLGFILERTRDVKDTVRRAAYNFLAQKVHVRSLTIAQRIRILEEGLHDRSDAVRRVIEQKLLPAWLKLYNNNMVNFLRCLDVQDSVETAQLVLNTLFKFHTPQELVADFNLLSEEKIIPKENASCESFLFWRCLCQYLKSQKTITTDECIESILPELTPYCYYMKGYILNLDENLDIETKLEHEFECQQLLLLAGEYDLADQAGRNCLNKLVTDLLMSPNVEATVVKPLVACYHKIHSNPEDCFTRLTEIISDVREPIMTVENELTEEEKRKIELKLAKLRVDTNILKEEMETCIKNQNFTRAQEVKEELAALETQKEVQQKEFQPLSQEVRVEKNDPQTLLKCVTIVSEFLELSSLKTVNPTLHSVIDTLLLPGIQNEDPAVRNQAVKALGLCCLSSQDLACQHLLLFMQISQVDQETIQVTALKVILDLLLLFGLEAFKVEGIPNKTTEGIEEVSETPSQGSEESITESQENQRATSNIMTIIAAHLDSESREVRTLAAEGIGKLLIFGHIYSPRLLSHLLLLWYNPATENDVQLRHFLGVFLPAFASTAQSSQECLEEAFMPTLHTLFDAPASSPLADIDETNLARFVIQLTNPSLISSESKNYGESSVHDRLAEQLCNEILRDRESFNVRVLAKSLTYLELSCNSYSTLKNLAVLTKKITEKIKDRTSLKLIEKFQDTVFQLLAKAKEIDPQASQELSFVESTCPEIPNTVIEESQTSTTGIESDEPQTEKSTSQEFFNDTIRTLKTRKKVKKSVVLETGSKNKDVPLTPQTACLTVSEDLKKSCPPPRRTRLTLSEKRRKSAQ